MSQPRSSGINHLQETPALRIGTLLRRLHQGVTATLGEQLRARGIDLTRPQAFTLRVLAEQPGVSNAELARLAAVSPQTMHQILMRLERDGLVRRSPHPQLKRVLTVELTDHGRELVEQGGQIIHAAIEQAFSALRLEEKQQLIALLERCLDATGAEEPGH